MTLLEDLELECLVVDGQLSVLENEVFHDVAVVDVYREDFSETNEDVVLNAVFRVDEGSEFLSEVDGLINGNLGSLLLVLLEKEG